MKTLRIFINTSLILVYLVILAGAVVRMTGSGMGCPDWPKCFGYMIPPTEYSQLEWKPNHDYAKGNVIIVDEALRVAKNDFRTTNEFNDQNWAAYTKHDYATFNATHTWVEFINRLLGALAGLATLALFVASLWKYKLRKIIPVLAFLVILGMGFQAWLGKTVVDSNLLPHKITIHMAMALVILGLLFGLRTLCNKGEKLIAHGWLKKGLIVAVLLSSIQIYMGTQVRQFIDLEMKFWNYENASQWLREPPTIFLFHRSFSIVVLLLNVGLYFLSKKFHQTRFGNGILFFIALEILSGMALYYLDFPLGSQPLHLLLATALFGMQLYWLLRLQFKPVAQQ